MEAKPRILTNNQMAEVFGGYDFRTDDMRRVCYAQDAISFKAGRESMLKEVKEWMDENCLGCRSNTPCNTDEYLGFHKESWQVFLKEKK
jgi:hypothetical protein